MEARIPAIALYCCLRVNAGADAHTGLLAGDTSWTLERDGLPDEDPF